LLAKFGDFRYIVSMARQEYKEGRFRARRNKWTINNPFLSTFKENAEKHRVVDINNLTDEEKAIYQPDKHDYRYIYENGLKDFVEFAFCEYMTLDDKGNDAGLIIAERVFFKDYESACEFFKRIDFVKFVCFQGERGEKRGTLHFQGFMTYKRPMDRHIATMIYPTMILKPCYDSNAYYRDYCKKEDTAQAEYPYFEDGEFVEERERTDTQDFKQLVANHKIPISEVFDRHPTLTVQSLPRIKQLRQELLDEKFSRLVRDVHVIYMYGPTRQGKSTSLRRIYGLDLADYCKVGKATHTGKFDKYNGHDVIVFDEFKGIIPLTEMNEYLEGEPVHLPARNNDRVACYTKVFIMSNYTLAELYKKERDNGEQPSYDAFVARIAEIIHVPERNKYVWERGKPSKELVATMTERGDKFIIKEQPVTQTTIEEVF